MPSGWDGVFKHPNLTYWQPIISPPPLGDWVLVSQKTPITKQRVYVIIRWKCDNKYQYKQSVADYIAPRSVLVEDYMDPEFLECETNDYDEENDCFWTPGGWYESCHTTEINYFISDEVIAWKPLDKIPGELRNESN